MDVEKFQDSPIGELVRINGTDANGRAYDHFAFVPKDLPEEIQLSTRTWKTVAMAHGALGRLDGLGRQLPNTNLLARPMIRAEAVSSAKLEGTYTTLPEIFQSELFEDEAPGGDRAEVLDQIRASEYAFSLISQGQPLGLNLIKEIHAHLMASDPRCPMTQKGEFRDRQNYIGPQEAPIDESSFVPPPPGPGLIEGMNAWEIWSHHQDTHPLVRMAVGHYQFETLHPFFDGNGRMGRLIAVLLLLHEGELNSPLLNISPYLEARRDQYQMLLRQVSKTGDFDPWVSFFCEGVRTQSEQGLDKIKQLLSLKDQMITDLRDRRMRGLVVQIAEDLIGFPALTVTSAKERYSVSYQAASNALNSLTQAGHVMQGQMPNRQKLFVCNAVYRIVYPE